MNHENWSIAKPQKSISFLLPSVGRKVVETVDMVQTVSLQLPVDGNSISQVTSGPIWKISKIIFMVLPGDPTFGCSKTFSIYMCVIYVCYSRNLLLSMLFYFRIGDKQKTYSEKILDELLEKARWVWNILLNIEYSILETLNIL